MLRLRGFVLALALIGSLGCADKQCDAQPLQDAWKPYESLLPDNVVICGANRMTEGKTIDDNGPKQLFVYYNERDNVAKTFEETVDRFEGAGWTLEDMSVVGEGKTALFDAELRKDGVTVHIGVNNNDFGMQGAFSLSP